MRCQPTILQRHHKDALPRHILVVALEDSWLATRFGLPKLLVKDTPLKLRTALMGHGDKRYRLDVLPPEKVQELMGLLRTQKATFEVWQ